MEYVSLQLEESREDVAAHLLSQGLVLAENKRDKHLAALVTQYLKAQEKAKSARVRYFYFIFQHVLIIMLYLLQNEKMYIRIFSLIIMIVRLQIA